MANKHEQPPQVKEGKKPRLFYFEDALNARCPLPEELEKLLLDWWDLEDGDDIELHIFRHDMTDAEFDAIPEE